MFGCYLLQSCSLLTRDRKGVDPIRKKSRWEESGGGEIGGDTVIRIYCMKKNLFSTKKKNGFFKVVFLDNIPHPKQMKLSPKRV